MSGSETGSEDVAPGRAGSGGAGADGKGGGDLASRTLVLESKRFYLDVKENTRGRFIKMAEISSDGRKNQILMTIPTAAQFRKHLESMITFYQGLEAVDANNLTQGELRSEVIIKEDKKYHVDLKASVPCAICDQTFSLLLFMMSVANLAILPALILLANFMDRCFHCFACLAFRSDIVHGSKFTWYYSRIYCYIPYFPE